MVLRTFLIRRILLVFPVLFGVSVLVFLALHLAPGNPAEILLGSMATKSELRAITIQLGLNQPWPVQYWDWITRVLVGNMGQSITLHQAVSSLVYGRLLNTLYLSVFAFVFATVFGIAIGIVSSVWPRGIIHFLFNLFSFFGLAFPVFWLSMIFILVFGLVLHLFPTGGMYTIGMGESLAQLIWHITLPAIALAIAPMAVIAQLTQVAVHEELNKPYILTVRAKGAKYWRTLLVHAVRNALIPIVTALGLQVNYVIGGDVLVETVFSWPGIGQLLVQSVLSRDYPTILGASLVLAAIFVIVNLCVDALYSLLDPRLGSHG